MENVFAQALRIMRRFSIIAIGLALFGITVFAIWKPKRTPDAVAGASTYFIPEDQRGKIVAKALGGDCQSAYRLGLHYFFTTADEEEAVRWYRLAAKCPDVNPKADLVALLADKQCQSGIRAEIEKLIEEITKHDPKLAESAQVHTDSVKADLERRHAIVKSVIELRGASKGVAEIILRGSELTETIAAAERGNCQDANRLADHYLFALNHINSAIEWYRVAVRCPQVEPKVALVALLAYIQDEPEVMEEISKLMAGIEKQDSALADRLRSHIDSLKVQHGT